MRVRVLVAGLMATIGGAVAAATTSNAMTNIPVPPDPAEATVAVNSTAQPKSAPTYSAPTLPAQTRADVPLSASEPPLVTISRKIVRGETLVGLLAEAGIAAPDRAEIALALDAEYDLRRLRSGDRVTVSVTPDGAPRRVTLEVDDGLQIEAVFGDRVATRIVEPVSEMVTLAGEALIDSSIFAALDQAGLPARFAVDLAQMLGGTIDFRRDLSGGETLRLMWREARVGDATIGQPKLTFTALDLGDVLFEIVWPGDGSGRATIYRDGKVMRVFAQPVEGARLSSVFGRRRHPIYGNVRMHTGVDFAAALGTPVHATAPGRVSFIGRRSGYGRVVEVAHGADTMTRYAHLSTIPDGLAAGDRVAAGDIIGKVGATGTATGPNLHYEVRVNGRPTDPLADDRLAAAGAKVQPAAALTRLEDARARLAARL